MNIPAGITNIDYFTFAGCSGLTSVTIPDSVTSIGNNAFEGCTGINSVSIPIGVTSISDYTFAGCSGLTSVIIPDSVTSIGNNAFEGCTGLTTVSIPIGITSISDSTFAGCSGLTSVNIPENVTRIGKYAFSDCSGLTTVTIPENVTSIGKYAFYSCSGLASVNIPAGVKIIGDYVFFGCAGLTSVTIPNSVTNIGDHSFACCTGLTSITIPDSITSISSDAFFGCVGLTSVNISAREMIIGKHAFSCCSQLTSVTIGNGVNHIDHQAFLDCPELTSVIIPDSVTSIGNNAFGFESTEDGNYIPVEGFLIYGVAGSKAESYAQLFGFTFIEFSDFDCTHDNSEIRNNKAATCGKEGYTGDTYCLRCAVRLSKGKVVAPTGDHTWDDGEIALAPTCVTEGKKVYICEVCGMTEIEQIPVASNNHTNVKDIAAVAATCSQVGNKAYTYCGACSAVLTIEGEDVSGDNLTVATAGDRITIPVDPDNHIGITETRNARAATCVQTGNKAYTYCGACSAVLTIEGEDVSGENLSIATAGERISVAINPNNHTGITEIRNSKAVTCGEDGYTGDTYCKSCGAPLANGTVIPKTGNHNWDDGEITTLSTCASEGIKTFNCAVCGDTKTEPVSKNANNHAGGTELRNVKASTCGEDGYTGDTCCKGCGAVLTSGMVVVATGNHTWNSGTIMTPATCASEGVKTFTCTGCGAKKTATIAKNANNHAGGSEFRNVKTATCNEDGYTGDICCKGCGAVLTSGTVIPKTGNHSWNNGAVTTAATCAAEGVKTYTCTVCGATKTEAIVKDANNHTGGTELRNIRAATCGENGYSGDTYCKGCGTLISSGTIVPKTENHSWNAGTVTTPATCAAGGVKTFTCTVCGDTKTEAIEKDANNHTGGIEIRNAVASSDGSDGYTGDTYCKGCGVKLASGTVIPAPTTIPETTAPATEPTTAAPTTTAPATSDPTTTPSTTDTPVTEPTTAAPSTTTPETTAPTTTAPASTTTPTTEPTTTVPTTTSPATTASTSADTPTIPDKLFDFGGDDTGVTSEETADTFKYASKAALTKSELVAAITAANDGAVVTVKDKDGNDIPDDAAPGTGSTVTVTIGGATVTKTLIVLGDVDGDGNINASDARLALRAAAKLDTLEGPFASASDTDGDGSINAIDARGILRAAAKLDVLNVA